MKHLLLLILAFSLFISCDDETNPQDEVGIEELIIGRWHLSGFDDRVLYEFTENYRYTIYGENWEFGGLETAIPNPNPWFVENDKIHMDLHFGNELSAEYVFKCNNQVLDLYLDGELHTTLYRENYSLMNCNE
ncbi:MAG: hypothetical protein ACPGR7_08000 [Flavobacteriaceae bacterium]